MDFNIQVVEDPDAYIDHAGKYRAVPDAVAAYVTEDAITLFVTKKQADTIEDNRKLRRSWRWKKA